MPWEHADNLELVGLERWGMQLAKSDREAGVCALVLAAHHGVPRVREWIDATVDAQLEACARWVDAPSEANLEAVEDVFDPTYALHVWDPEDRPADGEVGRWYRELGQIACAAIVKGDGDAASTSYYYWPAEVSVGRGLVVAVRGLRAPGVDVGSDLRDLYAALCA